MIIKTVFKYAIIISSWKLHCTWLIGKGSIQQLKKNSPKGQTVKIALQNLRLLISYILIDISDLFVIVIINFLISTYFSVTFLESVQN